MAALEYLQEQRKTGDEGYVIANKLAEKTKVAKRAEIRVAVKPAKVTIASEQAAEA